MADASLGTAVLRTRLDKSGLTTGLNQAKGETQRFARDSSTAIQGIGAAFGAVAASAGVRAYVRFLTSTAQLAQQADASTRLYEKSLARTNQSLGDGAALVQRLSDRFGVANTVIQQSATLLLRQGASLDDIDRALTAAGASAAAAGFDISTAFDNVATAVATGRSELLETSGIVTNLGPVTQAYARSVGKTVDELTQQEIIQARVNAIYRETASEIEDVDEILQGLPLSQARWTQELREAKEGVGAFTKDVLVPIVDTGTAVLRIFNDLPDPVKRAGTAMSGAAIGATALATGIIAIRTALTGLSALGLLSFGPAGWIVAGVTVVAGLVAVLAGKRSDTLEGAVEAAGRALAGGDAKSLTSSLDRVISKVDGDVKDGLTRLRDELRETGEVGEEMGRKINEALSQAIIAQAQAEVEYASAALRMAQEAAAVSTSTATPEELLGPLRDRIARLGRADLAEMLTFREDLGIFSFPAGSGTIRAEPEIWDQIEFANRQLAGNVSDHAEAVSRATEKLAEAQARLDALVNPPAAAGGAGAGGGAAPTGTPSDPVTVEVARWESLPVNRGPSTIAAMDRAEVLGPGAGMATGGARPVPVQIVPDSRSTNAFQYGLDVLRQRGVAAAQDNAARAEVAAAEREEAAAKESLLRITLSLRDATQRGADATARLVEEREREQERANIAARGAALSTADLRASEDAGTIGRGTILDDRATAEAERQERQLVAARESQWRITASLNEATRRGIAAERELLDLRKRAGFLTGKPGEAAPVVDTSDFWSVLRARGSGGTDREGIVREADADRIADAAAEFATTVLDAGRGFVGIVESFQSGNAAAGVSGIGSTVGSLLGGFGFGQAGAIVTGVFGLVASLVGLGSNRSREEEERRRAADLRRSQVSTLEFNFTFNQTNTFTGDLTSSANQSKLREAGIMSFRDFEQFLKRSLLPRIENLEARTAVL